MNLIINIPNDRYEWIKNHEEGITDYQTTLILYNQVQDAKSLEDYLDEIKKKIIEAQEKCSHPLEIIQAIDIIDEYMEGDSEC